MLEIEGVASAVENGGSTVRLRDGSNLDGASNLPVDLASSVAFSLNDTVRLEVDGLRPFPTSRGSSLALRFTACPFPSTEVRVSDDGPTTSRLVGGRVDGGVTSSHSSSETSLDSWSARSRKFCSEFPAHPGTSELPFLEGTRWIVDTGARRMGWFVPVCRGFL